MAKLQSVSLIRENVGPTIFGNRLFALEMPGLRSMSMLMVARAQNDEAPIWDAATDGGSTVIIEDAPTWEN